MNIQVKLYEVHVPVTDLKISLLFTESLKLKEIRVKLSHWIHSILNHDFIPVISQFNTKQRDHGIKYSRKIRNLQ